MPQNLTDDKSTLVQVMAWCRHATSHYLNQCWPRSSTPYGVTRPQWVKIILGYPGGYCRNITWVLHTLGVLLMFFLWCCIGLNLAIARRDHFDIKTIFTSIGIVIIKIRRSQFIKGILVLLRRHLYIGLAPWVCITVFANILARGSTVIKLKVCCLWQQWRLTLFNETSPCVFFNGGELMLLVFSLTIQHDTLT